MERQDFRAAIAGVGAAVAAAAFLLVRTAPDVGVKPLFEDEAVAGLIAARPLTELLGTVMVDRGGAPLHFVLAHAAFWLDGSWTTLRWLSVVFALATVLVCYDLGRRLAGPLAGASAAFVAAGSHALGIYGSFGRMYALFAFSGALAVDLFVRAVERRTRGAAAAAAAAAWLLPAIHPYGVILVAAEALVALPLWLAGGRPVRAALPVGLAAFAMVPFAAADLRLGERFELGVDQGTSLAQPEEAWSQLGRAIASFSGGHGPALGLFVVLAALGVVALVRTRPAFPAVAALALLAPPLLFVLVRTGGSPGLSPRHLIFALPLWAGLVGAGFAGVVRSVRPAGRVACLAALAAVAALAPGGGIVDPRDPERNAVLGGGPLSIAPGRPGSVEAPVAWLRETTGVGGGILFPYSPVYLGALPEAARSTSLPYAQADLLLRTLARVDKPVSAVTIAIPLVHASVDSDRLAALLPDARVHGSDRWVLVQRPGPFGDGASALAAAHEAFAASQQATIRDSIQLDGYVDRQAAVLCEAMQALGRSCRQEP